MIAIVRRAELRRVKLWRAMIRRAKLTIGELC